MSLYEDRTFENLQAEALEELNAKINDLPENQRVDASPGSLLYMAIAKQAVRLEEAYADLDDINDNMLVDTQDYDHLLESGIECGMPMILGTTAVVSAELNCECEIGDEFSAVDSDYNYIAVDLIDVIDEGDGSKTYRYQMEAEEEGIDPGSYRGDIEPEDYLEGFETGSITGVITPGTEDEEEEEYRERRLNNYTSKACAGNRDYYKETIGNIVGVGGVKVQRRQTGQSVIPCYIQAADYGVPTNTLLAEIKEIMDPDGMEGEGAGLCPMGHILDLHAVEGVDIDVTATFTFDAGYTFAMLETAMKTAVSEYISEQASGWQNSSSIIIRRAMIESKLLAITGIIDIADLLLNEDDENITVGEYQVPVMGTIEEGGDG